MNPIVHAELGWLTGQALEDRRDRILVTAAGVIPDLDGLTILGGVDFYGRYHHVFSHGWVAALVISGALGLAAKKKLKTALFALLAYHVHLLCDLVGSGPGWPLFYLWPFSDEQWYWSGQWNLASWQNGLVGLVASLLCLATAFKWRRTIVEVFSLRADAEVVKALWARFRPGASPGAEGGPKPA